MRPYVRPLIVTFSALALASLFSYAAIALTDTPSKPIDSHTDGLKPEAKAVRAFLDARAAAAGGDPAKLMALANFHLLGIGTEKSEREAARLHGLGAAKGHAACQYFYGRDLLDGIGVKKDVAAGFEWIRKAAAQQDGEAEYFLYLAYHEGKGVEKDHAAAHAWMIKAAEHGQFDARVEMAEEILVNKDEKRYKAVVTWVLPGAKSGHPKSCHVMSYAYQAGIGVKNDPVEAVAWRLVMLNEYKDADANRYQPAYDALSETDQAAAEKRAKELCGARAYQSPFARDPAELAAERSKFDQTKQKAEAGDVEAQFALSELLEEGKGTKVDQEAAVHWLRRASVKGHANSQFALGLHLRSGEGVLPDPKEAYLWFRKAAEQGDEFAEHAVAVCLRDGEGVQSNLAESKQWLLRAAEHGHAQAQAEIGGGYYEDEPNIAKDAIAIRWFRKSAEQFNLNGLLALGYCYLQGRGTPKDKIEGLAWMTLGRDRYDEDQLKLVIGALGDCTEDELNKIDERAMTLRKDCLDKYKAAHGKPVQQ